MKIFFCDLKRAAMSWQTLFGLAAMLAVMLTSGVVSDLFRISVPLICTLPYTTAWLSEYQNNFVRYSLYRSSSTRYIVSKFLSCIFAGGAIEALAAIVFVLIKGNAVGLDIIADQDIGCNVALLFLSGMLWAGLSATLAALSNSRYIAYGGSFIIFWFIIILRERYFTETYFLDPRTWYAPSLSISGGKMTAAIIQLSVISALFIAYFFVLRRKLRNV